MVPRALLMKSGLVSVNTARQVNVAHSKTTVNAARPKSHFSKPAHSTVKRPIHKNTTFKNSNFNQRVNTIKNKNVNIVRPKAVVNAARPKAVLNVVKRNQVNAIKASACWGNPQMVLPDQGVNPKEGKSQAELTDESHVLLKLPRKNNMYSVDLKNVVPKGGLTCLFAKATSDESELWHRRLGHINFKTMNKLVKGNLVFKLEGIEWSRMEKILGKGLHFENIMGLMIYYSLKVQRVLLMLDSNLQEMMKRRLTNETTEEKEVVLNDDEDVGAEADMNNLDAIMPISPIPTKRVHKDHPVEQIIGDLNSAPQTRRMTQNLARKHAFV
ncbi:putative ribonuclease H-like domain-containing protein [Tanacetum coccineum]